MPYLYNKKIINKNSDLKIYPMSSLENIKEKRARTEDKRPGN